MFLPPIFRRRNVGGEESKGPAGRVTAGSGRQGPGESVQFGDDQGVAVPAGGERFAEAASFEVAAGQSVNNR